MTTLSVALATYNGARFLQKQLDSIARQTRLPDELVVADDGSTDQSLDIIRAFAATVPFRVVILAQGDRLGYRGNFMRCARQCRGDLIAFCDQDDVWLPEKLAVQERVLGSRRVMMSSHRVRLCDDADAPLGFGFDFFDRPVTAGYAGLPPFPFALGMTICMKRECLMADWLWPRSLDWYNDAEPMAHDQWYPFIAALIGQIDFADAVLAEYRQHGANTSGQRSPTSLRSWISTRIGSRQAEYRRLGRCASNCADMIRLLAAHDDDGIESASPRFGAADDFGHAAALYDRYAAAFHRRVRATEARWLRGKLRAFGAAIRNGDYRFGSQWHFKPHSILRDLSEF